MRVPVVGSIPSFIKCACELRDAYNHTCVVVRVATSTAFGGAGVRRHLGMLGADLIALGLVDSDASNSSSTGTANEGNATAQHHPATTQLRTKDNIVLTRIGRP